jgi:hypothetical protein
VHIKIYETENETIVSKANQHISEYNFCKCDDHIYADMIKIIQVTQDHQEIEHTNILKLLPSSLSFTA